MATTLLDMLTSSLLAIAMIAALMPIALVATFAHRREKVLLRELSAYVTSSCWCPLLKALLPSSLSAALQGTFQKRLVNGTLKDARSLDALGVTSNARLVLIAYIVCFCTAGAALLAGMALLVPAAQPGSNKVLVVLRGAGLAIVALATHFLYTDGLMRAYHANTAAANNDLSEAIRLES